jgi:DNA-binding FadR family transcriptional regulator
VARPLDHQNASIGELGPIRREAVTTQAVERIKAAILRGVLPAGSRLPAERELAAQLGIARSTLREAIHVLTHLNILEARHGQGTFVTDLRPAQLVQPLDFALALDARSALDLFECRRVVECGAAPLAAERISDEAIAQLERHHEACAASIDDVSRFLDHDLAMHELLVDAAGNLMLSRLYRTLLALGTASRRRAAERHAVREQALRRHGEIVEAIRARNGEWAAEAMAAHLREFGASVVAEAGADAASVAD